MGYYVYLLECSDKSLYCGWTVDLKNRLRTHLSGKGSKFVRSRLPAKMVYYESLESKHLAMCREAAIKKLNKEQKLSLISSKNNLYVSENELPGFGN